VACADSASSARCPQRFRQLIAAGLDQGWRTTLAPGYTCQCIYAWEWYEVEVIDMKTEGRREGNNGDMVKVHSAASPWRSN
jgi:hypothetical protein